MNCFTVSRSSSDWHWATQVLETISHKCCCCCCSVRLCGVLVGSRIAVAIVKKIILCVVFAGSVFVSCTTERPYVGHVGAAILFHILHSCCFLFEKCGTFWKLKLLKRNTTNSVVCRTSHIYFEDARSWMYSRFHSFSEVHLWCKRRNLSVGRNPCLFIIVLSYFFGCKSMS